MARTLVFAGSARRDSLNKKLARADHAFDERGALTDEHAGRALANAARSLVEIAGKLA